MANDTASGEKAVPVYLSFKTFQAAIQNLRTHGLPGTLDRTAFDSRSGAEQTQILSAFKFLGLIDEQQHTQASLRRLRDTKENSPEEKSLLQEILKERYGAVFALDLESTTPGALEAAIGEYGATGTTRDRAVRFFIKAAEHAGVKLSSRLTRGLRSRSSSPRSMPSMYVEAGEIDQPPTQSAARNNRGKKRKSSSPNTGSIPGGSGNAVKTIALRDAGGTLSLSGTFDPFDLDGDERKLVYEIVDLMKAYERQSKEEG